MSSNFENLVLGFTNNVHQGSVPKFHVRHVFSPLRVCRNCWAQKEKKRKRIDDHGFRTRDLIFSEEKHKNLDAQHPSTQKRYGTLVHMHLPTLRSVFGCQAHRFQRTCFYNKKHIRGVAGPGLFKNKTSLQYICSKTMKRSSFDE